MRSSQFSDLFIANVFLSDLAGFGESCVFRQKKKRAKMSYFGNYQIAVKMGHHMEHGAYDTSYERHNMQNDKITRKSTKLERPCDLLHAVCDIVQRPHE